MQHTFRSMGSAHISNVPQTRHITKGSSLQTYVQKIRLCGDAEVKSDAEHGHPFMLAIDKG